MRCIPLEAETEPQSGTKVLRGRCNICMGPFQQTSGIGEVGVARDSSTIR